MQLFRIVRRRIVPVVAALLACALSYAGHYRVAISGGTYTEYGDNGTVTFSTPYGDYYAPMVGNDAASAGYGTYRGSGSIPIDGWSHSTCAGTVTATFDWVPDAGEDPPHTIVVEEAIGASASVPAGEDEAATTGVDGEESYPVDFVDSDGYERVTIVAEITRYTVEHDAAHFTLSATPTAHVSVNGIGYDATGFSEVSYQVQVGYPGIVAKTDLLIGQNFGLGTKALLDLTPAASGTTPAYQWSIGGNSSYFKQFQVVDGSGGSSPFGSEGEILLSAADLQTAKPPCYFANMGDATANCTVHYATPAYSLPAAGLDIALDLIMATVRLPTFQPVSVHLAQISLIPANSGYNGDPNNAAGIVLNGFNNTDGAEQIGINYQSSVTTPNGYSQTYTRADGTTIHDIGGFVWVQLINPTGRMRTLSQGTIQTRKFGLSTSPTGPYWTTGLDLNYPYRPLPGGGAPNTATDGQGYLYFLANGNTSNSGQSLDWWGEASDRPAEPWTDSDADSVMNGTSYNAVSYHTRDDFTVYQLYRPPGIDSQYVPLQSFHWYWSGDGDHSFGGTITPADDGAHGVYDGFPGSPPPITFDWFLHNPINASDSLVMLPNAVAFPSWSNLTAGGTIEFRYRNP